MTYILIALVGASFIFEYWLLTKIGKLEKRNKMLQTALEALGRDTNIFQAGITRDSHSQKKELLIEVKRINKKESAPLTSKKSRLNKRQLKDALKFWTNTGNAIAPLLRHIASKQIAGETLTNQEIAVLSENTKTIEPLLKEHRKREDARKRITEIDQEIKKI